MTADTQTDAHADSAVVESFIDQAIDRRGASAVDMGELALINSYFGFWNNSDFAHRMVKPHNEVTPLILARFYDPAEFERLLPAFALGVPSRRLAEIDQLIPSHYPGNDPLEGLVLWGERAHRLLVLYHFLDWAGFLRHGENLKRDPLWVQATLGPVPHPQKPFNPQPDRRLDCSNLDLVLPDPSFTGPAEAAQNAREVYPGP